MLEQVRRPGPAEGGTADVGPADPGPVEQELIDLGPVPLDGLEGHPDPFTPADEQWDGEPVERPSDDDRFGHLDAPEPPLPEGGWEGDLAAAHHAWAAVQHRDWQGASQLFDALERAVHRPDLAPGIHDEHAFDVLPLAPDAARAHFVIVDLGAERWMLLDGPFADFDAAFVPLHNAAKRFSRQFAGRPDAGAWRCFVLAVPEPLAWVV